MRSGPRHPVINCCALVFLDVFGVCIWGFSHICERRYDWISKPMYSSYTHTVYGRNPAPVDIENIPCLKGFHIQQVVSRISSINSIIISMPPPRFLNKVFVFGYKFPMIPNIFNEGPNFEPETSNKMPATTFTKKKLGPTKVTSEITRGPKLHL